MVSVPRRFGAGTLIVVTTLFAVLFGALRFFNQPIGVFIGISAWLTVIGVAQMFGGRQYARAASIAAGVFLLPATVLAAELYSRYTNSAGDGGLVDGIALLVLTVPGALLGYVGGVFVAGVFLVMHWADSTFGTHLAEFAGSQPNADGFPISNECLAGELAGQSRVQPAHGDSPFGEPPAAPRTLRGQAGQDSPAAVKSPAGRMPIISLAMSQTESYDE